MTVAVRIGAPIREIIVTPRSVPTPGVLPALPPVAPKPAQEPVPA